MGILALNVLMECSLWVGTERGNHGRNFGLKSGGTNSEGERGALGSRGENGAESILPYQLWVWESVLSSPSGVRGGAPAENGFIVIILISADRLC